MYDLKLETWMENIAMENKLDDHSIVDILRILKKSSNVSRLVFRNLKLN